MSLNARSIATLGLGFGALAVASIGLNQADAIAPPVVPPVVEVGGGGRTRIHYPREIEATSDIQDEDDIMLAIIMQAVTKGIL